MEVLCLLAAALCAVAPGPALVEPMGAPSTAASGVAGNTAAEAGESECPGGGQQEPGPLLHPHPVPPAGPPGEAALRLAGGSGRCEGTVQALHQGHWVPVCRRSWSTAASQELCHRLSCGDAEDDAVTPSPAGEEDGTDGCPAATANCSGWEPELCRLWLATEPG
ncbi:DMBT1 protein, partial [Chauna torquata]|nr:DMBT1 protein [Chauna torquata]